MTFETFLPIAGLVVNPLEVILLGLVGGIMTGLLGVGGGILVTPMLMLMGVPPLVAVATQVNSTVGISFTGYLSYRRNHDVDGMLGRFLLIGGCFGAIAGVKLLSWFESTSHISLLFSSSYIVVLGLMGILLFNQSLKAFKNTTRLQKPTTSPLWIQKLPGAINFKRTRVRMSLFIPICVGGVNAILTSAFGMGNSLFMIPVLTYLVGRTSPVVQGTTMFAGVSLCSFITLYHGYETQSIDLLLLVLLLVGGVVGSQIGISLGYKFPRPILGLIGSVVILLIALKFVGELFYPSLHLSPSTALPSICPKTSLFGVIDVGVDCSALIGLFGVIVAIALAFIIEMITHRIIHFGRPQKDLLGKYT